MKPDLNNLEYLRYKNKQKAKLDRHRQFIESFQKKFRDALTARLAEHKEFLAGSSVLCLAARLGSEVEVFWSYGSFAVGIDLNPGSKGRVSVLKGDFHSVKFPDNSADVIYTNSLDHSRYPKQLLSEVKRVLKPGGHFILEAMRGSSEGGKFDSYDIYRWKYVSQIEDLVEAAGFEKLSQKDFKVPWLGVHYLWHYDA